MENYRSIQKPIQPVLIDFRSLVLVWKLYRPEMNFYSWLAVINRWTLVNNKIKHPYNFFFFFFQCDGSKFWLVIAADANHLALKI